MAVVANLKIVVALAACALCAPSAQVLAPAQDASQSAPRTASPAQRFEFTQLHMGVPVRLVVYAREESLAREACSAAFARVAELDQIASDYRPTSELMQLCAKFSRGTKTPAVPVSADLWSLLHYSQLVSKSSKGGFDVSVGPLVKLWREARRTKILPAPESLREARSRSGWKRIVLEKKSRSVRLKAPGMALDLGGIAKGYAGDCALQVLAAHGIASALFEAGGDIVASAPPPGEIGWKIRLPEGRTTFVSRGALSTSGDTVQWVEVGGRRYSHVVDPRTGLGLSQRWIATVWAPRGITADALSTAATIAGPSSAARLQRDFSGTRIWVRRAPEESKEAPKFTTDGLGEPQRVTEVWKKISDSVHLVTWGSSVVNFERLWARKYKQTSCKSHILCVKCLAAEAAATKRRLPAEPEYWRFSLRR